MAFLATTDRFAPDLDKCRKIHPNPSTYEPVVATVAGGAPFHTSSRYGTIGPHHDVPIALKAAASPAAKLLAAVETPPTSINSERHKAPTPWHYAPTVRGQFARVYTVDDLEAQRRQRLEDAKRTAARRSATSSFQEDKPEEVQHLALGPGTYEVDKDRNLEQIAVPFSFSKEPRRGILECTVGVKDLHADRHRLSKYSKRLSSEQRRRSETALLPLRHATMGPTNDATEVAAFSKELAKSYAELQRSTTRLERKMSSPVIRNDTFQRFQMPSNAIEGFRRGPGSYFHQPESVDTTEAWTPELVSPSVPLEDPQRQELESLLARPIRNVDHGLRKKKASTFGLVKQRDMLTSMTRAGHLSAVAVEDALGPGVYDTPSSTFHEPTHNLLYKAGISRKTRAKPKRLKAPVGETDRGNKEENQQQVREKWLAMRRGPSIPQR